MLCNSTEFLLGYITIWKDWAFERQPEVISCSTLSAVPTAVPVLVTLIMGVLPVLKVWRDPQVEEGSGVMLKLSMVFVENLHSSCSG